MTDRFKIFTNLKYRQMIRSKDEVKMTYNQDGSFDMHFISSDIHIDRNHTARVIAPSCGDGKTTMIKYIMKHYFQYGILVAVDTIDEVKMYGEYIKNELIGYTSVNGFTLTDDDYILLHSKNENKQFEYTYASNPLDIMNKAIVVCTHHKFFNNDPRIFIHMNMNIMNIEMAKKMGSNSLSIFKQAVGAGRKILSQIGSDGIRRRQFILIDEMPRCEMLRTRFDKLTLSHLVKCETKYNHKSHIEGIPTLIDGKVLMKETEVVDEWIDPTKKYTLDNREALQYRYRTEVKGTKIDMISNNREIDNVNSLALLDLLYDRFDFYTRGCPRNNDGYVDCYGSYKPGSLKELPEYIDVSYNLSTLAFPDMEINLWIFDGTGDLTFCEANDMYMSLPDINSPKFQSPMNFYKIDISSGRNFRESTLLNNYDKIQSILDENIKVILSVFRNNPNGKTLINGWKTFRFSRINKNTDEKDLKELKGYIIEEGKIAFLNLTKYYTDKLTPIVNQMKLNGELGPDFEFSFIYYQSGLDRATNQFKDYDSIVFLGEFIVPQSAIDEHNISMGAKTDLVKYTVHQLVQATCRLRVRKHTGEPINVYYTSDWNEKFMVLLGLYMSDKPIEQKLDFLTHSGSYLMEDSYIANISNKLMNFTSRSLNDLRPKWRKVVRTLCDYDKAIEDAIVNRSKIKYKISLDELYKLIPLKDKEVRKYNPLVNQLKSLGIDLVIESRFSN